MENEQISENIQKLKQDELNDFSLKIHGLSRH
jgi:hypothetical protein